MMSVRFINFALLSLAVGSQSAAAFHPTTPLFKQQKAGMTGAPRRGFALKAFEGIHTIMPGETWRETVPEGGMWSVTTASNPIAGTNDNPMEGLTATNFYSDGKPCFEWKAYLGSESEGRSVFYFLVGAGAPRDELEIRNDYERPATVNVKLSKLPQQEECATVGSYENYVFGDSRHSEQVTWWAKDMDVQCSMMLAGNRGSNAAIGGILSCLRDLNYVAGGVGFWEIDDCSWRMSGSGPSINACYGHGPPEL